MIKTYMPTITILV